MGGGDLNSKKAWHPNTMKNQERVWKAEQAAAEEKKRILELERERAQERDREELNKLAKQGMDPNNETRTDNQLHWMYDKPDKKVQQEDYLLGKAIENKFDSAKKSEPNEIPAVSRRVIGSSMTTSSENVQVDLARKLREDPLLLVKERERAARAALLNNPVQRRKLTELLRKEQEQRKAKSEKSSKKKKSDLDEKLVAKLNAIGGSKVDLAKLLASGDSSSDSSSEEDKKKSKKKKKKKDKKREKKKKSSDTESTNKSSHSKHKEEKHRQSEKNDSGSYRKTTREPRDEERRNSFNKKRHVSRDSSEEEPDRKSRRRSSPLRSEREKSKKEKYNSESSNYYKKERKYSVEEEFKKKRPGLSEEEKAAKLSEMAAAGAERELSRGERVARQRLEMATDDKSASRSRPSKHNEARALPDSLENRIHSNRHYIQRDRRHMNEHFARR